MTLSQCAPSQSWCTSAGFISSNARVRALLQRLPFPAAHGHALDIGCGGGEWLRRLLCARPALRATGVDASGEAVDRARVRLTGIQAQILHEDAQDFLRTTGEAYDIILCNGSTHALGGLERALNLAVGHESPSRPAARARGLTLELAAALRSGRN